MFVEDIKINYDILSYESLVELYAIFRKLHENSEGRAGKQELEYQMSCVNKKIVEVDEFLYDEY